MIVMKDIVKKILNQGSLFLAASLLGNLLNLVFNFYLGRSLSLKDFSLVALFMSILYATNIFFNALSVTTNHSVGISPASIRQKVLWHILSLWRKKALLLGVFVSVFWILASSLLADIWKVNTFSIIAFLPIFLLGVFIAIHRGVLQGNSQFTRAGLVFLSESSSKLLVAITFVLIGFAEFSYLSIPLSVFMSFLVSIFFVGSLNVEVNKSDQLIPINIFSRRFFVFSLLLGLSTLTFLSFDIILAKAFFSPHEAGGYALLTLVGKIIFLSSSLLEGLIVSFVSNALGENKRTEDIFLAFLSISLSVVIATSCLFLLLGKQILLSFFGEKVENVLPFLPIYVFSIATFSVSHAVVFYHHARREFLFPTVASLSAGLLILGTALFHGNLEQFIRVFFVVSMLEVFVVFILHAVGRYHRIDLNDPKYSEEGTHESHIKKLPTVTVGIPAYNEQNNIGNILQQILSQKQVGFVVEKVIVASDGSTDDTVKVVSKYLHLGVQVIPRKENKGKKYTQNEIIKNTTTDILVLLDADILLYDEEVLIRLIEPILSGADLSASWTKPLVPKTFLEKILCAGFDMKYHVYTHYKDGNNIYTCIGANRAFSRSFYKNVNFPSDLSGGEDQYLYLCCVKGGYKYQYAGFVKSYFKLPDTLDDYAKYARRIFQTQIRYQDIFGEMAISERKLPKRIILSGFIYGLMKKPVYTTLYCFLHIIAQHWALRQSTDLHEVSSGTKSLIKEN